MRRVLAASSLILAFSGGLVAADVVPVPKSDVTEVVALLNRLPSQQTIWREYHLLQQNPPKAPKAEIEAAQKTMDTVKEVVPKLRKLLKTGVSVFTYPTLLAHGDVTWTIITPVSKLREPDHDPKSVEWGYRLYVGMPVEEFVHPYDFQVLFDSTGTIRSIEGVDWKR
jgi:hypothetical protein